MVRCYLPVLPLLCFAKKNFLLSAATTRYALRCATKWSLWQRGHCTHTRSQGGLGVGRVRPRCHGDRAWVWSFPKRLPVAPDFA
ncbi:ALI_collapsed_G0031740.mRNA.1.CDS.1 [Saccharomyces cerevisiae]|nr:ALI_collapsed_G0031740.mRNA.1.CDS.1 [Saccharomyces cerevisiae]